MKIEEGKRYVRRDGKISGVIMDVSGSDDSPFWDDVFGIYYDENGLWISCGKHDANLIGEYVEHPTETETLRDRFAMAALNGFASNPSLNWTGVELASFSYALADAMMDARKK